MVAADGEERTNEQQEESCSDAGCYPVSIVSSPIQDAVTTGNKTQNRHKHELDGPRQWRRRVREHRSGVGPCRPRHSNATEEQDGSDGEQYRARCPVTIQDTVDTEDACSFGERQ